MKHTTRTKFHMWLWIIIVLAIIAVGVSVYCSFHWREYANDLELFSQRDDRGPDKEYDYSALSTEQQKLVTILEGEYSTQSTSPPSGTKYSEGVQESWCADFVSWVMKQYGQPFVNPNSGSWRIPGTYTLKEYFQSKGNWHPYGDGYQPKTGDIAIYDGNGPFGQHTNFVLTYDTGGRTLTTMGGNEMGSIHVQQHRLDDDLKVVGFAEL
jgi:hypothetical protein